MQWFPLFVQLFEERNEEKKEKKEKEEKKEKKEKPSVSQTLLFG